MFRQRQQGPAGRSRLIYLVATPGHPNFGDEVVTRRWLELLASAEPGAQVWVDCPVPGAAAALLSSAHPDVHFTDTIFRMCWEAPTDDPAEVVDFVMEALSDPGQTPRWIPGIDLLRRADVFHLVGGGYVNTIWPRHLGVVGVARWLVANTGARVAATGQGLMPAAGEASTLWRRAAEAFDVLTVRDKASLEMFGGAVPARLAPDDIFLGSVAGLYARDAAAAPAVMVCVQDDLNEGDFAAVADTVAQTLRSWDADKGPVGVVECIPRVDRRIYDSLLPEFPDLRFYSLWDLLRDGFPAAAHQRWISTRYYPHLLAAAAGAQGVSLSVRGDYYDVKHGAARQMGSGWPQAMIGAGPADVGDPGRLPARAAQHTTTVLRTAREIYGRQGS